MAMKYKKLPTIRTRVLILDLSRSIKEIREDADEIANMVAQGYEIISSMPTGDGRGVYILKLIK